MAICSRVQKIAHWGFVFSAPGYEVHHDIESSLMFSLLNYQLALPEVETNHTVFIDVL